MNRAKRYGVVVQAGPDEILGVDDAGDLNLKELEAWSSVDGFIVALPAINDAEAAAKRVRDWGYQAMVGDAFNVARRLVDASAVFDGQAYVVRVLAFWKNIDMSYVDQMVAEMEKNPCDFLAVPRDFDVTMAADIGRHDAIKRVADMAGDDAEVNRAKFNAFGYMESHSDRFDVRWFEPAPVYDLKKREAILGSKRYHPENEFFGRDYAGSRYHFLLDYIPHGARVLDIACGSGLGSKLMASRASLVVGSDYLDAYIQAARERFPENERLQFIASDGQSFVYQGGQQFDVVVSLHTLEHVPDDRKMIRSLAQNLRPGGMLIMEVPILATRPMGVPTNPYHLREYSVSEAVNLVESAELRIIRRIGYCRGFPVAIDKTRDAVQLHAVKDDD